MRWSPRLVTVAGIPVRVNWSFAVLLALVVAADAESGAGAVVRALVWLTLLFGSVVVHELAHCAVARRRGLHVRDIVLLPIGGVSEIEDMGRSAADEWRIAAVGPATSLALAAVLMAAGAAAGRTPWPPGLTTGPLVDQLAWVNVVLGFFNLLPALPMDGGRVLRAALAVRLGQQRATEVAARLATVLGVLMVVGGILYDIVFALIGILVMLAARGEEQAAEIHAAVGDRTVADLVVSGIVVLPAACPVSEARDRNRIHPWFAVAVADAGHFEGMVTPDRLATAAPDASLGAVADRGVPVLHPTDALYPTVAEAFARSRARQLPVESDGRIVGIVDLDDVQVLLRRLTAGRPRR